MQPMPLGLLYMGFAAPHLIGNEGQGQKTAEEIEE